MCVCVCMYLFANKSENGPQLWSTADLSPLIPIESSKRHAGVIRANIVAAGNRHAISLMQFA